jgi:hypothetical protein
MWLKDTIHYEQLDITYQNRLIIQLQGIKGTDTNYKLPFTTIWSTSRQANDLYGSNALKPMIVKSYTKDYNYDNKIDELHIIGSLPLQNDEVITSATVLAFMDAELTVSVIERETVGKPNKNAADDGAIGRYFPFLIFIMTFFLMMFNL